MAYQYDVFLSYPRTKSAGEWVRNHFHHLLVECLEDELAERPRVFFDETMTIGTRWPENIRSALLHSRMLVAVWTPTYFKSDWCMAEWMSMLERERLLGLGTGDQPGLVFPVTYSDGKHFHPIARNTQSREDFKPYTCPVPILQSTALFVEFHAKMRSLAAEIAQRLDEIPEWQPDWPIKVWDPEPQTALSLAQL